MQQILKRDDEQRVVYGWASIIEENGRPVVDHHGDIIEPRELERAALQFITDSRAGGFMHAREGEGADARVVKVAEVVASFPLTRDIQKAFGINLPHSGWIIGVRVLDDAVWQLVKSGALTAFSIGGSAKRSPMED